MPRSVRDPYDSDDTGTTTTPIEIEPADDEDKARLDQIRHKLAGRLTNVKRYQALEEALGVCIPSYSPTRDHSRSLTHSQDEPNVMFTNVLKGAVDMAQALYDGELEKANKDPLVRSYHRANDGPGLKSLFSLVRQDANAVDNKLGAALSTDCKHWTNEVARHMDEVLPYWNPEVAKNESNDARRKKKNMAKLEREAMSNAYGLKEPRPKKEVTIAQRMGIAEPMTAAERKAAREADDDRIQRRLEGRETPSQSPALRRRQSPALGMPGSRSGSPALMEGRSSRPQAGSAFTTPSASRSGTPTGERGRQR